MHNLLNKLQNKDTSKSRDDVIVNYMKAKAEEIMASQLGKAFLTIKEIRSILEVGEKVAAPSGLDKLFMDQLHGVVRNSQGYEEYWTMKIPPWQMAKMAEDYFKGGQDA